MSSRIDIEALRKAAAAVKGWANVCHVWRAYGDEAYIVGHINEDGDKYPVVCVDTQQYYEDSPALANFYAAANPAVILALLDRLEHAEAAAGAVPEARAYTDQHHMAVTQEWLDGWNALRKYLAAPPAQGLPAAAPSEPATEECWVCAGTGRRETHSGGGTYSCGQCEGSGRIALQQAAPSEPVAWAVTSERGGIHKLSITRASAERKLAAWQQEWPNNGSSVRPLVFGDATPPAALAAPQQQADDSDGGVELLDSLIANIEKHGNYSKEATLTFLGQIKQCFAHQEHGLPPAAAPASQLDASGSGWISVDERLPENCTPRLAVYVNSYGNHRRIRAMYVKQFEIEANGDECDSETRESDETEWLKAGWYECIDNWGEYSSVTVSEGVVTHWQDLPPAPDESVASRSRAQGGKDGEA